MSILSKVNIKNMAASDINQLHETDSRWFAVFTRVKCEKMAQRQLHKKGIHAYVPLQRLLRRYQRSTRLTEKPLINCYVFVRITKPEYLPVLETENVLGFVRFNKDLIAIPEAEIELLRRITLEDGLEIEVAPGNFAEGDLIEIRAGNLAGLRGRIIRKANKQQFQVELQRLGFQLLLTVDAAFLEKTKADLTKHN